MPTVLNKNGCRLIIYTDDHSPAHVHVWRQGSRAIIEFEEGLFVRKNYGLTRRELAIAKLLVEENLELLLLEWRKIHG